MGEHSVERSDLPYSASRAGGLASAWPTPSEAAPRHALWAAIRDPWATLWPAAFCALCLALAGCRAAGTAQVEHDVQVEVLPPPPSNPSDPDPTSPARRPSFWERHAPWLRVRVGDLDVQSSGGGGLKVHFGRKAVSKLGGGEKILLWSVGGLAMLVGIAAALGWGQVRRGLAVAAGGGVLLAALALWETYPWVLLLAVLAGAAVAGYWLWTVARNKADVISFSKVVAALDQIPADVWTDSVKPAIQAATRSRETAYRAAVERARAS